MEFSILVHCDLRLSLKGKVPNLLCSSVHKAIMTHFDHVSIGKKNCVAKIKLKSMAQ